MTHASPWFQSPMGIVSSAKHDDAADVGFPYQFQSPMGIVSSAKSITTDSCAISCPVSIPDGDSFLREAGLEGSDSAEGYRFQSPMGIVSSAKHSFRIALGITPNVSIPDGDSFLREVGIIT